MPRPQMVTRSFHVTVVRYLQYEEKTETVKEAVTQILKSFKTDELLLKYLKERSQPGSIPVKIISTSTKEVLKGMTPEYFYKQSQELEDRNTNRIKKKERTTKK